MGSKFGWHSGNFRAKNFLAGTFLISGATTTQAVTFPKKRWFNHAPKIILSQENRTNDTTFSSTARSYNYFHFSGALGVSGVTVNGFTFATNVPCNVSGVGTASVLASGVIINYYAFDYQSKRI